MTRLGWAAIVLVAGVVLVPSAAAAHTTGTGIRNLVDAVNAPVDVGIRTSAADELVLTERRASTVEVLAPSGEPFLRITNHSVEANTNSVTWYASESLSFNPITSVPGLDPAAGPRWLRVADTGTWAWFDPRLRPDQPADAIASTLPATRIRLASWTVTLKVDGRDAQITGHREYRPAQGSYEQQIDTGSPAGAKVAVIGGPGSAVPAIYVENDTAGTLTVLGAAGEPLLRITPGAVDANTASPSWLLAAASRDEAPTGLVSAAAPPRGKRVANQRSFSWLDERGRAPGLDPPPGRGSTGRAATVGHWSFGVTFGASPATVRARIIWQPLHPGSASSGAPVIPVIVGGAAGAGVASLGLWWWQRRRVRYHH